jgi:hypothetical protein
MAEIIQHPAAPNPETMHTFTKAVLSYLPEALNIATDRGGAYGDTWALENRINTFKKIVFRLPQHPLLYGEFMRLVDCAGLIDTKHSRYLGGFKRDHTLDGINYEAMFGYLMEDYQEKLNKITAMLAAAKAAADATPQQSPDPTEAI